MSEDSRTTQEKDNYTSLRRKSLRKAKSIPAANDEQSVSQNVVVINSENSNTDLVCTKRLRRANRPFGGSCNVRS